MSMFFDNQKIFLKYFDKHHEKRNTTNSNAVKY